jgi:hypothetical protein
VGLPLKDLLTEPKPREVCTIYEIDTSGQRNWAQAVYNFRWVGSPQIASMSLIPNQTPSKGFFVLWTLATGPRWRQMPAACLKIEESRRRPDCVLGPPLRGLSPHSVRCH